MFAAALIIFREVLEAALIIGIVSAATRSIPGRTRWLIGGIVAGLIGSIAIAAGAEAIAGWASGMGQELFNTLVLSIAVLMLAWHNVWVAAHGKQLANQARSVGRSIEAGTSEASILFFIVGLAVLREGSETVLFLYGIAAAESGGGQGMLVGGLLGLIGGALVGWTLYAGLLRVPLRWFFSVTSALVLLLAAGMAAQAARYLIQADVLPSLANPLWDSSALIPQNSIAGTLLHGFMGYDARPAGMQMVFYTVTLVTIAVAMKWAQRPSFKTIQQGVTT